MIPLEIFLKNNLFSHFFLFFHFSKKSKPLFKKNQKNKKNLHFQHFIHISLFNFNVLSTPAQLEPGKHFPTSQSF